MLEAVAAGQTDGDSSLHVEECPTCRAKLEEIRANNMLLVELMAARNAQPASRREHALAPEIDDYEILAVLGRGAQGTVYRGIQKSTKRQVAVKLLVGGALATRRQRHRFEREVELAAALRHPNIVTVFDSGVTGDGRHFYVMELIAGDSLDQFLARVNAARGQRLSIAETLQVFLKICSATEYAHQHGIIHRDLKPANILIDASNEPRIVDFGLAKNTDAKDAALTMVQTQAGEFAGTFAYASPEQTQAKPALIDTRTDVYALGVILYEMLTGELPYTTTGSLSEVLRAIAEEPARNPADLRPDIDHELETILLKALAKEPERRYQSAGLLARDIERYLADEPIDAKRDSAWYMLRKTVRRHRWPVAVAAAAVVMLAVFAVSMSIAYRRASRAELKESARSRELAELLSISNIERGRAATADGNTALAEDLLWREYFAEHNDGTFDASVSPARWALRELYLRQPCLTTVAILPPHDAHSMLSTDARTVAIWKKDSRAIDICDVPRLTHRCALEAHRENVFRVAISGDGTLLALVWEDGAIELLDVKARRSIAVRREHAARIQCIVFSRDGATLASGDASGVTRLWDTSSLTLRHALRGHAGAVQALAFNRDGKLLASSGDDLAVKFWDTGTGQCVATPITSDRYPIRSLAISPDNSILYTAGTGEECSIWQMPTCASGRKLPEFTGAGYAMVGYFSRDGARLACAGDRAIPVWNLRDDRAGRTLAGHTGIVNQLAFADDGKILVSTSSPERVLRVWDMDDAPGRTTLAGHEDSILSGSFSYDGAMLATASSDHTVRVWTISTSGAAPVVLRFDSIVQSVSFAPDRSLAAGFNDGTIRVWKDRFASPPKGWKAHDAHIYSITFSPDGTLIASTSSDRTLRLWDVSTTTCIRDLGDAKEQFTAVRFSKDGKLLASAGRLDYVARVWDVSSGSLRCTMSGHTGPIRMVCFTPDGRTLATSSDDRTIRLWDMRDGRCIATLGGHTYAVNMLSFSGDGRLLASAGGGGEVKLWDVEQRRCLATMSRDDTTVFGVNLSPDARRITTWGANQLVTIWDLSWPDRCIAGNEPYWRQRLSGLHR
jgi:WD40 repeat protein/tRNA A-37 threonylcarbamoyl transferase component Bud32